MMHEPPAAAIRAVGCAARFGGAKCAGVRDETAIAAQGRACQFGQSQAAPRTPDESPCLLRRIGVAMVSLNA